MGAENKKAFDPTTCFTFYGSWLKAIEKIETEQDRNSIAYSLFKAIANYSMYDVEPDFESPTLNALWLVLEREIDSSVQKRKQGFSKDMMNENYQKIIKAIIDNPSASLREIGTMTGTDKNMVDRVKKKYKKLIDEAVANATVGVCDTVSYNAFDSNNYSVTDNDIARQDSETKQNNETISKAVVVDEEYSSVCTSANGEFCSDDDMPF